MEFWPSSSTSKTSRSKIHGRKPISGASWTNYPVTDHGVQSAATLVKVGDELEWRTVQSSKRGSLVTKGEPSKVFPWVRPKEITNTNASLRKRAEHGAKFLRTYHPDVDIPFEVIRDALQDDDDQRKQITEFDPYAGNMLSATYCFEGIKKKTIALSFPTGTLNNELNVSPITIRQESVTFQPRTQPVWTFKTPIRQLVTSSLSIDLEEKSDYNLAVRTYGQVTVFDIRNQATTLLDSKKPVFTLSEVKTIYPKDIQSNSNGGIVDMSFSRSMPNDFYFVTEAGTGYHCTAADQQSAIEKIFESPLNNGSSFWRIIGDQRMNDGIIASDRSVHAFDTRVFGTVMLLFDYKDNHNVITSIRPTRVEHLLCLSTTSQVIWLDDRYPKRPLLGWRHHRAFDRSLSVQTIEFGSTSLAFLGSSKNNLISTVAVGRLHDGPLQCQMPVRALSSSGRAIPITGRTLIRHPGDPPGSFSLLELSERGSVHHQELQYVADASSTAPEEQEHFKPRFECIWSGEVHELERHSKDLKPNYGKLAGRESMKLDLSGLYRSLFDDNARRTRTEEEEANAEEVYQTLENMPDYWQRSETGEEHMRTLFDVAFSSGSEPLHEERADFLTGTVLDSTRGYRARHQGRIPVAEVAKKAGWHMDVRPVLHKIAPDVFTGVNLNQTTDANEANEAKLGGIVEPYHIRRDDIIPEADRLEAEAREQLALDLTLASDIFNPTSVKHPNSQDPSSGSGAIRKEREDLEDAHFLTQETEKLSLNGREPPHVQFGFLRPVGKAAAAGGKEGGEGPSVWEKEGETTKVEDGETAKMPLGVRLLLSKWNTGEDPYTYEYADPYGLDRAAAEESQSTRTRTAAQVRRRQQETDTSEERDTGPVRPVQSQVPPTIVAARSLSTLTKGKEKENVRKPPVQTQYQRGEGSQFERLEPGSLQPPAASTKTQVEPGRFGGRQTAGAKKTVKKRIGGF